MHHAISFTLATLVFLIFFDELALHLSPFCDLFSSPRAIPYWVGVLRKANWTKVRHKIMVKFLQHLG